MSTLAKLQFQVIIYDYGAEEGLLQSMGQLRQ